MFISVKSGLQNLLDFDCHGGLYGLATLAAIKRHAAMQY